MAPTGTSGPSASSAQTSSASPGDGSPSGCDIAGESPSVPSPDPQPVDDEEEEELPKEEEALEDAADESMEAPSGRSSTQTPSRLLLLDRALALQDEIKLPSGRDIPRDRQLPAPARYEVPPEHTPGRQMNELTIGSLAQLYDFFDENVDIHDYVLTPRKKPLSEDDMEHQLNHVSLKREIASILTEFGPENLSQRVFGTVDVLQKDYQFQTDYWSREVADVLKEHADDKRHLKEQVATLTRRLDDSEAYRKIVFDRRVWKWLM
ncbi:hypothetical protein PRNP1_013004 [Phytophthora ramorum]